MTASQSSVIGIICALLGAPRCLSPLIPKVPTKVLNKAVKRNTSYTTRDVKEIAKLLAMVP